MDNRELSKRLGSERTETHILTHNSWNSMPEYFSRGCNETSVRSVKNGIVQDDFFLIQHSWLDWQKAGEVIKHLLAKGKAPSRISDIMDYMKERGWANKPSKGKTL